MTRRAFAAAGGVVLVAALVFALFPVQVSTQGAGFVQPVFEEVVRVTPTADAMIAAVYVTRGQRVGEGDALLGFVPWPDWAVHGRSQMTLPGGKSPPEPAPPDWHREANARRLARVEAAQRWQRRLYTTTRVASSPKPAKWEFELASRLALTASLEGDVTLKELWAAERTRLGWDEDNKVYAFDQAAGMYRPVEHGQPYPSPATGIVVSLWATPLLQISSLYPVAEIMRDSTPIEVLGLIPAGSSVDVDPQASLRRLEPVGFAPGPPSALSTVAVGRFPLEEDEVRELVPELAMRGRSTFVRLRLIGPVPPAALGRVLHFELVNRRLPRIWIWLRDVTRRG
jgi:hypothetical protein